jgi:hypothetical protein
MIASIVRASSSCGLPVAEHTRHHVYRRQFQRVFYWHKHRYRNGDGGWYLYRPTDNGVFAVNWCRFFEAADDAHSADFRDVHAADGLLRAARATFAVLMLLFSISETRTKGAAPIVTIPAQ